LSVKTHKIIADDLEPVLASEIVTVEANTPKASIPEAVTSEASAVEALCTIEGYLNT
ncbi:hypothetical protein IWW39_006200, partial [Coemansia spiralis]